MPSQKNRTASAPLSPSNAFSPVFLRRLDERDEPITSAAADMAGPWAVLPVPGLGFGVFREGEHPSRGFRPVAVFPDRFLALLTAAALPTLGRGPLLFLAGEPEPDGQGYVVRLDDGTVVGHLAQFGEPLLDVVNAYTATVSLPASLACVLEAAGAVALKHCGAILDARVAAVSSETGL